MAAIQPSGQTKASQIMDKLTLPAAWHDTAWQKKKPKLTQPRENCGNDQKLDICTLHDTAILS